ncbi:hypothetical protein F4604DRAFT_1589518 [Suillus subluteus]|nr:hypothetical protein F4604DRAFT_1589518 [Suillus subluteus]
MHANLDPLLPTLIKNYIQWKAIGDSSFGATPGHPIATTEYDFEITVLDIFSLTTSATIPQQADSVSMADALIQYGYLGNVPYSPSIATSLRTLEHFRLLRLCKPSFSVEAFAKVICDSYGIPYHRRYRTILADTFDIHLTILRHVSKQVDAALGRDTPNWRVLNSCPPCTYELQDEPRLQFCRMYVMDGGNSAKRITTLGDRHVGDMRNFNESDYLLPHDYVDSFANEVQHRAKDVVASEPIAEITSQSPEEDNDNLAVTSTNVMAEDCSKNWKATASDEKKRMWAIFEETGIFVAACRHGFILWYADMVRSGELAKYPLAIISKVLDVLGERSLGAYDIGCGFTSTIENSSLGENFRKMESRMCVDAFHGYAHNYVCQTKNHPLGITGAGLEDFETIEQIFSASNQLATVTHYSSSYRHHALLELFFKQWDEEKYLNVGTMILNNYKQALGIINSDGLVLQQAMNSLRIHLGELETWHAEEVEYFCMLGSEPEWDVHAMAYVELLQEMQEYETQSSNASTRFISSAPSDYVFVVLSQSQQRTYAAELSHTRKLETHRRYTAEKLDTVQREVIAMEVKLGITCRWTPSTHEYQETMKYMATRKYHRALDNLQRLVVQCLFELQKLNISQIGNYSFAQTHCKAIQSAVKKYNEAASEIDPPRPPLEWSRVSHYNFLDKFNLLQETRQDICEKPCAKPAIRETMRQYLRVQRAKEEIICCNVEACRLHTAILDKEAMFSHILKSLEDDGELIFFIVKDYCTRHRLVNTQLLGRISQLYLMEGFTGDTLPGTHIGQSSPALPLDLQVQPLDDEDTPGNIDEDDEVRGDIEMLIEYISELPVAHSM